MHISFVMTEYVDLYDIFLFQNKADRPVSNGLPPTPKVHVSETVIATCTTEIYIIKKYSNTSTHKIITTVTA